MKAKEIRELAVPEIDKKLRDERDEYLHLRLGKKSNQVEKTHRIKELRRDIARLETILREKSKMTPAASS